MFSGRSGDGCEADKGGEWNLKARMRRRNGILRFRADSVSWYHLSPPFHLNISMLEFSKGLLRVPPDAERGEEDKICVSLAPGKKLWGENEP